MYLLLLTRLYGLPCFSLISRLANSCACLSFFTTALFQTLQLDGVLSLPAVSICFIFNPPVHHVPGAHHMWGRTKQSLQQCQPSGKGCSVQSALPLQLQRREMHWARKGFLRSISTSKLSKRPMAGPASSLGEQSKP